MRQEQKGRLRRLRLSKKCKHFFEGRVALRSAPRLSADGGQFDAHSARSIFCHAHVAAENDFTFFTACGRRTLRGFFDKLRRLLAGVLAGAMVLPLSACGGKGGPYVDIPPAYRSWDEDGKAQDFSRLGTAEGGMVAAMRYEAAKVGTDILDRGGNVVDAAVATALALTVTMPEMCGLAGGGYMTYYCGETGETVFLNFRETTPAGHTPDLWPEDGQGGVEGRRNQFGGLSVGVPGEVDGLYYALETYGTMDWADVVRPAIGLAREGFTMTPALQGYCQEIYSLLLEKPELGEIYLTEQGLVKPVGEVICNAPMAKALELLRDQGPQGFYTGAVAEAMVDATQASGGVLTLEDLEGYACWEEEPLYGTYRGYTICTAGASSSGGAYILETLNLMEQLPVHPFDAVEHWHQLAEVQKLVWADRETYAGDTRFVDVPVEGITSKAYAGKRVQDFDPNAVRPCAGGDPWAFAQESPNTTSFSVADSSGSMVTVTHTINYTWGSRVYVDGYGFFMNNELGDFAVGQGKANALEPGKCPLSSMSPTVILDPDGRPWMTCGAPGGAQIYPAVAQVIMNAIDYGMDVDQAVNAPRIAVTSGGFAYRRELSGEVVAALEAMGHRDMAVTGSVARPSAIMFLPDGTLAGSVESDATMSAFTDGAALGK